MAKGKKIREVDLSKILDKAAGSPVNSILYRKVIEWFGILSRKERLGIMPSRMLLLQIVAGLVAMIWDLEAQLSALRDTDHRD